MSNRILLRWFLSQLPHTEHELSVPGGVPGHSQAFWESFERALSTPLSVAALTVPPYVVQIVVTNGFTNWTIASDGATWTVERTRARRGRPASHTAFHYQVRKLYADVHPEIQQLKRALTQLCKSLGPAERSNSSRSTAAERHLRSQPPQSRAQLAEPSRDPETSVLIWAGEKCTNILWSDFVVGRFEPRGLAIRFIARQVDRKPGTIRNALKPYYRVQKPRARK